MEAIKRYGSKKMIFGSDNTIDGKDTFLHNKTGDRSLYQEYFNELREKLSKEDYDNQRRERYRFITSFQLSLITTHIYNSYV